MECQVCCQENEFMDLECECHYCLSCLLEWVKETDMERCLNCNKHQDWNLMLSQNADYQCILTDKYLRSQQDIQSCPKCNYRGIAHDMDCHYECAICFTKWKLKKNTDIKTTIFNVINTKKCPQCQAKIIKNGGCPTMRCAQCRYEFCWICLQNERKHSEYICYKVQFIRYLLYFIFIAFTLHQFNVFLPIITFIGALIYEIALIILCPIPFMLILPIALNKYRYLSCVGLVLDLIIVNSQIDISRFFEYNLSILIIGYLYWNQKRTRL